MKSIPWFSNKQHRDKELSEKLVDVLGQGQPQGQKLYQPMPVPMRYDYQRTPGPRIYRPTVPIMMPNIPGLSNPDIITRKVRDKFCEPIWQARLREKSKKFPKKLISLRFHKFHDKPSFTIGNNIDFGRFCLSESHLDVFDSVSIRKETFRNIWDDPFPYRKNMIVCGIYVDESLFNRTTYHEQIARIFLPEEVISYSLVKLAFFFAFSESFCPFILMSS